MAHFAGGVAESVEVAIGVAHQLGFGNDSGGDGSELLVVEERTGSGGGVEQFV